MCVYIGVPLYIAIGLVSLTSCERITGWEIHLISFLEPGSASAAKDASRSSGIAHLPSSSSTADIELIVALIAALILELTRVGAIVGAVIANSLRRIVVRIQRLDGSIGIVGCPCACV